jgi:hypothetical protein
VTPYAQHSRSADGRRNSDADVQATGLIGGYGGDSCRSKRWGTTASAHYGWFRQACDQRNTAFTYKGKNADARQIGKELGVRYVMEGSVQRDQNQVRVNTQSIDAESGGQLWAKRFDRPLANLFSMQDEIVASLASQLGAELITNEARRAESVSNPDSMDLYFRGMAWLNKGRNLDDLAKASDFFDRALKLDPDNLDALLGTVACASARFGSSASARSDSAIPSTPRLVLTLTLPIQ